MTVYYSTRVRIPSSFGDVRIEHAFKTNGCVYVYYAVPAERDPGTGKHVYDRIPIGRCADEDWGDGMMNPSLEYYGLFPERKGWCALKPKTLSVGGHVLFEKLIEDTGLGEILLEVLGRGAGFLLDLAAFCVTTEKSGQDFGRYARERPLFEEDMRTGRAENHAEALMFMEEIPRGADKKFQRLWCEGHEGESVYMSFAGYGFWGCANVVPYDRTNRFEDRTLEDFVVAYDKSGIPLMYDRFLTLDVCSTQLRRAEKAARECGLGGVDAYMMTGGMFMDDVFRHFKETGSGFVMVSDRHSCERIRRTMERVRGSFEGKDSCEVAGRDVYAVTLREPFPNAWDAERSVHVVLDPSRRAGILKKVYSEVDRAQTEMDEIIRNDPTARFRRSYFFDLRFSCDEEDFEQGRSVLTGYVRNEERIEEETGLAGYYVLATSSDTTAEEALGLLDWKDPDETLFMNRREFLPDYCETSRQGDKSRHLIEFVALIIRSEIFRTLREKEIKSPDTGRRMSVEEALRRLDGIKAERGGDGAYALGGIDAAQEGILSAFGITKKDFGRRAAETLRRMEG